MRRRGPVCSLALAGAMLVAPGCATSSAPPATIGPTPIASLPHFEAALEPDPVFGGDVYVMRAGPTNGVPVVLLHGLGAEASDSWHPIVGALADEHRVVAIDLPGFGRSSGGNHRYTPFHYAKTLRHVLDRHVEGPVSLVGHSMGGAVAIEYAALRPAKVKRLVLVGVAGTLHHEAYLRYAMPGGRLLARAMRPRSAEQPHPRTTLEDPDRRASMLQASPVAIAGLALLLHDSGPALDRIRAPTLVLWGEDDPIASPRAGRALRARIEGARLEVLEGVHHVPMRQRPRTVARHIARWIRSPDPRPGSASPGANGSERVGRCEGDEKRRFRGAYARIELERCGQVRIEHATIGKLVMRDSVARLQDVHLRSNGTAIEANESVVHMTGGSVSAETCIAGRGTELDIAGATMRCTGAALRSGGNTTALFSVTRLDGPRKRRHLHRLVALGAGEHL